MTIAVQAGKKPEFDHCIITFDGYNRYLVPKAAALAFFSGVLGKEIYKVDSWWESNQSSECVEPVPTTSMPTLAAFSVMQFHMGRANAERRAEASRKPKEV